MMQICHFCGNKNFRKRTVQYIYRHNGNFLLVNNVPCVECEFCGEQYFEAAVLKKIEQDYLDIYVAGKPAEKEIRVPCEDFALV
ncbi:MAG: YgiT-type zinc finger protein [Candidatus Vecturithrix sp.]|nr:YgiT-type zinc finger protein [Candidatus Vecturithrix sp.]